MRTTKNERVVTALQHTAGETFCVYNNMFYATARVEDYTRKHAVRLARASVPSMIGFLYAEHDDNMYRFTNEA